jgi:hypothetical protein
MKTRQEIIADLYISKEVKNTLSKMQPASIREDLKQEIFLILCNLSEEKFWNLVNNNALKFWFARTMLNLIYQSRPSESFFKNFRAKFECLDDFNLLPDTLGESDDNKEVIEQTLIKLENSVNELHWYEKGILEIYIDCKMNQKKVSRETKIPYMSIVRTITTIKDKIKNDLK